MIHRSIVLKIAVLDGDSVQKMREADEIFVWLFQAAHHPVSHLHHGHHHSSQFFRHIHTLFQLQHDARINSIIRFPVCIYHVLIIDFFLFFDRHCFYLLLSHSLYNSMKLAMSRVQFCFPLSCLPLFRLGKPLHDPASARIICNVVCCAEKFILVFVHLEPVSHMAESAQCRVYRGNRAHLIQTIAE